MKNIVLLLTFLLATSLAQAADKTFVLPIASDAGGIVSDLNNDGKYEQVNTGKEAGMEWRVGRYFTGPVVMVMEITLPPELQGKNVKVLSATLSLSANGVVGVYPENNPDMAPDCLIYAYTGTQADGKVTTEDVLDDQGKPVGTEAGLFIESHTPLKAGTIITADITTSCQKALDDNAAFLGLRLEAKVLPDTVGCWRWRGPEFAAKYGKNYAPMLKLKVSVE
jgi:hypothetical protein